MKNIILKAYKGLRVFISLCIIIFSGSSASGQEISDTSLLQNLFLKKTDKENFSSHLKRSESEIRIIISTGFVIYKEFFSSQDVDVCIFSPSCSEYTMEAIERKGIPGMLDGLDRLMRCHSLAGKHDYPYNSQTKKFYDPL